MIICINALAFPQSFLDPKSEFLDPKTE